MAYRKGKITFITGSGRKYDVEDMRLSTLRQTPGLRDDCIFRGAFTGQISGADWEAWMDLCLDNSPSFSQYRYLYKRSILNPHHTKYRAYLRGAR